MLFRNDPSVLRFSAHQHVKSIVKRQVTLIVTEVICRTGPGNVLMCIIPEVETLFQKPVRMNGCFAARIQRFYDVPVPCQDPVDPPDAMIS